MRSILFQSACLAMGLSFACGGAHAQETLPLPTPLGDPDAPSLLSQVPAVPGISAKLRGLNGGVTLTSVHDSASGWYTLLTTAAAWTFSPHYSVDISVPLYLYRLDEDEVTTIVSQPGPPGLPPQPVQTITVTELQPHKGEFGDTVLAAHGNWSHRWLAYTLTPSMTMPSGDSAHGLSPGRVTVDVDNHFEASVPHANFVLGLGGGDSSTLFNRLVTKDYTSLGPLAHFQAGLVVPMPLRWTFESVAYEQLPLGDGKIYTTLTRPGYPPQTVVSGRSVSEDNGFTSSLTIPLTRHLTLESYYNRSLRLHLDTVSMGVTFVARPAQMKARPRPSPADGALLP